MSLYCISSTHQVQRHLSLAIDYQNPNPSKRHNHLFPFVNSNRDLHLQSLLPCLNSLDLGKRPLGSHDAVHNQRGRNNDPDGVAKDIIHVKVKLLRTAVHNVVHHLIEVTSRKVQHVAVELTNADDELDRVSQRVFLDDTPRAKE